MQLSIKYISLFLLLCLLGSEHSFAQNHFSIVGSSSSAKSGTSVAYSDFWSVQNNQAGMANIEGFSAGFYYENRYLQPEFSLKSAAIVMPSSVGNFGVSVNYFGYSKYNEQKIGLAYARPFGERFRAGLQFDYLRTFAGQQYGTANKASFEIGVQADISDKLTFGAHVFNPIQIELSNNDGERIPAVYRAGFLYKPSDELDFELDVLQESGRPLRLLFGTSFDIHSRFEIQAGLATQPFNASFGAGFDLGSFKLGIATLYHEILGVSPNATIIYSRQK